MPDLLRLAPYDDEGHVRVVVEAPRGARVKLKYEPALGLFVYDRALTLGAAYPYDWGFVPGTRAADGDPLDAIVLGEAPTWPGVVIPTVLIGVIRLVQRKHGARRTVRNDRVVAAPTDAAAYAGARDVPRRLRRELEEFFVVASKGTEKTVHVEGFAGPKAARRAVDEARRRAASEAA
jgi:inorganic pyrophosphatase